MKKKLSVLIIVSLTVSSLLAGCDEEMLRKIDHISQNMDTISNKFDPEKTAEIAQNVQQVMDSASNISTATAATEAVNDKEQQAEGSEIESEDIQDLDIDPAVMLGMMALTTDSDDLFQILLKKASEYKDKGEQIAEDASYLKKSGLEKIYEGLDGFDTVFASEEAANSYAAVEDTFNNVQKIVEGANEVVDGANLVITETTAWAKDFVDTADAVGIQTEEIATLKRQLKNVQNMKVTSIGENVSEELNDYKQLILAQIPDDASDYEIPVSADLNVQKSIGKVNAEAKDYMSDVLDSAEEIVERANETTSLAADMYMQANEAAQSVVVNIEDTIKDTIEENAASSVQVINELENAKSALSDNVELVENMKLVTQKDMSRVEKKLDKAVQRVNGIDFGKMVKAIK